MNTTVNNKIIDFNFTVNNNYLYYLKIDCNICVNMANP